MDGDPASIPSVLPRIFMGKSIYQQKLGAKFELLPDRLQEFHSLGGPKHWRGKSSISGGHGLLAKFVRALFGFPAPTDEIAVDVKVTYGSNEGIAYERWRRVFGDKPFHSVLSHRANGKFIEQFGILQFEIGIDASERGIVMPVIGWNIGPIPLPLFLAPKSETREYQDDHGRFCFDVKVSLPVVGPLMHYQGWLIPVTN